MKLILIILLHTFCLLGFSQEDDKTLLVVAPYELPSSFGELEKNQSEKIILKAVTRQIKYQIMLGQYDQKQKVKYPIHLVSVDVKKDATETFLITLKLFDERSKKLLNKIIVEKVEKRSFFRELEDAVLKLFSTELEPPAPSPKEQKKKIKQPKNQFIPPSEQERANIEFKKRIMGLKTDVDREIVIIKQAKTEQQAAVIKAEARPTVNSETSQEKAMSDIDNVLNPQKAKPIPPVPIHRVAIFNSRPRTVYKGKPLLLDGSPGPEVEIQTSLNYVGAAYMYQRPFVQNSLHYLQGEIIYGKPMSSSVEVSPYMMLAGTYAYYIQEFELFPKVGLEMETVSFANLVEVGGGFIPVNNRVTTLRLGSDFNAILFNQSLTVGINYYRPLNVASDNQLFKGAAIAGSKFKFNLNFNSLFKGVNLGADYYFSDYTYTGKSDQTSSTQGYGLNANYVF